MIMNEFANEFKNAFKKPENSLLQLILINLSVFFVFGLCGVILKISGFSYVYENIMSQLMLPASFREWLTKPWTIVSYFFLHKGLFHVLFNMLFLYWFGQLIMTYLGSKKLLNLYVLGGLLGGVLFMLIYNFVPYYMPSVDKTVLLGASAGVFAVVTGAATLLPNYEVRMLLIGSIKIKYIALFYILLSFLNITDSNAGGELSHLGGAMIGYFYIKQLQKGKNYAYALEWLFEKVKNILSFRKNHKLKVSHRKGGWGSSYENDSYNKNSAFNNVDQDEIDSILDKISENGYNALSKDEKQKLFMASKK